MAAAEGSSACAKLTAICMTNAIKMPQVSFDLARDTYAKGARRLIGQDHIGFEANEFGGISSRSVRIATYPAALDSHIATFCPTSSMQPMKERLKTIA